MINLALFASGNGSNVENIIRAFKNSELAVKKIFVNNPDAFVIERAKKNMIDYSLINRSSLYETNEIINELRKDSVDFIILAGFLWLIPQNIITSYENKIINIHPALLPKYGGKGMYGDKVHQAVINNHEQESGITIHLVNEDYDKGKILFQKSLAVSPDDTVNTLANKIHQLEYQYYPEIIRKFILNSIN